MRNWPGGLFYFLLFWGRGCWSCLVAYFSHVPNPAIARVEDEAAPDSLVVSGSCWRQGRGGGACSKPPILSCCLVVCQLCLPMGGNPASLVC